MSGVALPWMPNEGSSFVGRDRSYDSWGGIDPVPIFLETAPWRWMP